MRPWLIQRRVCMKLNAAWLMKFIFVPCVIAPYLTFFLSKLTIQSNKFNIISISKDFQGLTKQTLKSICTFEIIISIALKIECEIFSQRLIEILQKDPGLVKRFMLKDLCVGKSNLGEAASNFILITSCSSSTQTEFVLLDLNLLEG